LTSPAPNDPNTKPPTSERRRQLARQIATIDAALPGSIVIRHTRCGKPSCRCHQDPPQLHGPYIQWTRKINGRTRTQLLTKEQYERYKPWFENARLLRELLSELEAASLQTAREAEGWPPDNQP
jgi:hypothetical protein